MFVFVCLVGQLVLVRMDDLFVCWASCAKAVDKGGVGNTVFALSRVFQWWLVRVRTQRCSMHGLGVPSCGYCAEDTVPTCVLHARRVKWCGNWSNAKWTSTTSGLETG